MKQSIIFRYIDNNGDERLSIGNMAYLKKRMQTSRQLIEMIGISQTDEQRYYMTGLTQEELYTSLIKFMDDNELYVERPN